MKEGPTMPGSRVRETHAATVLSIVGRERMLPVQTRGTGFSMTGPFGWRAVASRFARGERDPIALARATMDGARIAPSINIAECGEEVSRRTYLAMIGGVSHEAFHRLYTQQGVLTPETIGAAIAPALAHPAIDWSKRARLVLDLQNVVEDIYIERLGCAEYPGVVTKMHDLADYIVRMEGESRAKAGNPPTTVASAVFVTWRDRGLGYNTPTIRDNLARIASECPQGVGMLRPGGVLHELFVRSVPDVSTPEAREAAKRALLDGVSLRIALEAVAHLEATSEGGDGPRPDGPSPGKPEKGDGPRPDGPSPGKPEKGKPEKGKPEKGKPEKGKPEKGDGESGDGESGDGEPGDGEPGDGEPSDGEPSDGESGDGEPGDGAGGDEGSSSVTAKDFLDSHDTGGKQSLDSNSALEAGVKSDRDDAPITDYDAPRPYRPFSTAEDETVQVRATRENAGSFANIVKECRKGTAYLRTRLAVIFRALENSGTEHGVRKGSALSPRTLVDSFCEMKGGTMPTRAYMDRTPAMDMSIAASVVIDESSSMRSKLRETCALTYTLMDALDAIGAKSMAVGFRAKRFCQDVSYGETSTGCHRTHAMHYDLFKGWGESFKVAAPRLREIRAEGGTPMADGVEFALNELSSRPEGHRILFVVTDGEPDYGHGQVLKSQLVRAASAGVLVVGVGLGHESAHVKTTFPDHVYSEELDALPALLVRKLEELVRTRATGAKRGRAVRAA